MQSDRSNFARRYDREFKENAVALIQSGRSITEVSHDVGVSHWSLSRWLKAAENGQALSETKTLSSEAFSWRSRRISRTLCFALVGVKTALGNVQSVGHLGEAMRLLISSFICTYSAKGLLRLKAADELQDVTIGGRSERDVAQERKYVCGGAGSLWKS